MYLSTPENTLIVKADPRQELLKLNNDTELKVVTYYEPGNWAIISGEVLAVPGRLTVNTVGEAYDNEIDLQPGDKVWFHHNMIRDEYELEPGIYWMFYEAAYAYERNGELFCVGDNILVDPIMETEDDIKTSLGIWLKANPEAKYLRATVKHIGRPKMKERRWFDFSVGDEIIYEIDSDIPLKINGHVFYRQKFEDVIGWMATNMESGLPMLQIQGNHVAVEPEPRETRTSFGLIMPAPATAPTRSKVLGIGMGVSLVAQDEIVYSPKGAGFEIEVLNRKILILREWMIDFKHFNNQEDAKMLANSIPMVP